MTEEVEIPVYRTTPRHAYEMVQDIFAAGLVPFLKSSPGIGKSSIIHKVARDFKLKMLDHRLSTSPPWDLSGLPNFFMGENGIQRARYSPMEFFPLEGDTIPEDYLGWLLFLDEFNSAKKDTQAASYKTILDKMTALHKLHEKVFIATAGNLDTDRAIVTQMSTAMQSRLITLELDFNFEEWMADVVMPQQWDPRVIAFLNFNPSAANDFKGDHQGHTFCCPRTWEFMSRLIKGKPVESKKGPLYTGTITAGTAMDFVSFCNILAEGELPKIQEIVHDPDGCRIPPQKNHRYGMITNLWQHVKEDNYAAVTKYIERMDKDFQILFQRGIVKQKPMLFRSETFQNAALKLGKDLVDF